MILTLVAGGIEAVAVVDVVHKYAEAGYGRQHKHVALIIARTDVVGDGDKVLSAVDAAEEGALGLGGNGLGIFRAVGDEDGSVLLFQLSYLINAQFIPLVFLYAIKRTIIHVHAGGHTHAFIHFCHGGALRLGQSFALAGLAGAVVAVGDVGVVGILVVFPPIFPERAVGIDVGTEFYPLNLVAALQHLEDDAAAEVIEHKRDATRRSGGIDPTGHAEVGIEIRLAGVVQHVVIIALAPGTEAQRLAVLPGQRVGLGLRERGVGAVAVLVVIALTAGLGQPVHAQTDVARSIPVLQVIGAIDRRAFPFAVVTEVVAVDAHAVVLVERAVVVVGIACGAVGEGVGHRHVEVDRTANPCALFGRHAGHVQIVLRTGCGQQGQQNV